MKRFMFINPQSDLPMCYETQDEAEAAAKEYIGKEDGFGDIVLGINILAYERVAEVKKPE